MTDDADLRPKMIYLTLKALKINRELTANTEEPYRRRIIVDCLLYDSPKISLELGYEISDRLLVHIIESGEKPFMGNDKPGRNREGIGYGLGSVDFGEGHLGDMGVALPPDSFRHFWAMAETGYMVENLPPRIEVRAETNPDHSKILNVTEFSLAASMEFGQESHPVVAELRAMVASGRSLLYKILAVFLVIWIVMIILDWLRH